MRQYEAELAFARSVAAPAAAIIKRNFRGQLYEEVKVDGTIVTKVDREINALVAAEVEARRPGELFLGEEDRRHTLATGMSGRVWVCDPLDGTWLFAGGVPASVFSLALVDDGRPVAGFVYNPFTGDSYSGTVAGRASLNGRTLRVSNVTSIKGSTLALPGDEGDYVKVHTASLLTEALKEGAGLVMSGSVINDAMQVAQGFATAHVFPYYAPWDMAAAKVIVEAAGGKVTNLRGDDQRYDMEPYGAIVSNGLVHDELVRLVRPHLKVVS